MKVLHQFMKTKNTTPEEIHEMAKAAGCDIPVEMIKAKMEFFEKAANSDEHVRPGGHGCGPGAWFKIVAQFMKDKNVTAEEIADLAKQAGHDVPVEKIKHKMEKFEQMAEEWAKGEKGEGKCGGFDWRKMCQNRPEGGWRNCMKKFMESKGLNAGDMQDFAKQAGFNLPEGACDKFFEGGQGNGAWKAKRAILKSKHDEVLVIKPGYTAIAEIEASNGTQWPWKQGCFLGMDDPKEGDSEAMPVEIPNLPIAFPVAGNQTFKLAVPLKVHDNFLGSDQVHQVHMSFRGPHGNTFGERITFKVRVEADQQIDEM